MKKFISNLNKVSNLGVDGITSSAEKRRIWLTNIFTMVGITFTCMYLPYYATLEEWVLVEGALLVLGIMGLSLFFNVQQKHLIARYLTVFAVCFILFVQGVLLGKASYVQMIYLPIFIGMIAIFDYNQVKSFTAGLCIPLGFLLGLEALNYGAALGVDSPKGDITNIYYLNLFSTITGSMAVMYFLVQSFKKQTDLLENQTDRIQREKERAEEAALAKTLFLSNISHEIRTPLNGLLGFAQLLAKSELKETQQEYLSLLQHSGETLEALLNDLLDITRIEQGKLQLNEENFDLQELVMGCCAPYQLQAKEKGLSLDLSYSFGRNHVIQSDPLRIKQILINLISNAIKYCDRGRIGVDISVQEYDITSPLQLKIIVQDTGRGIPADEQENIFQSFAQVNSTLPEAQKGLGLGLSIVKNLIEIMGGEITLESPVYEDIDSPGTRFTCCLPIHSGRLEIDPSITYEMKKEDFGQMTILVAEDNEINQILIQTILENDNFKVLMVENGQEAIDVALSTAVDVILMDVQMPILDGYEATKEIKRHKPNLPIVALSANAFEADLQKSAEAGMNDHLSKPLQIDALYTTLYELFAQKQGEGV